MRELINLRANGKINLFLKINYKLNNGYHNMEMINQSISLFDEIKIYKNQTNEINIFTIDNIDNCSKNNKIDLKENTMYKAFKEIEKELCKENLGIDVYIKKNIPKEAGLGGGSADAGAIINGVDYLYNLKLPYHTKIKIAKKVGADVPFCTYGGSMIAKGTGEILEKINLPKFYFIIIKPDFGIKTKLAFEKFDKYNEKNNIFKDRNDIFSKIKSNSNCINSDFIKSNFYNDFEQVIFKEHNLLSKIKQDLYDNNAFFAQMTGTGSTLFGLYENENLRNNGYKKLKLKYNNIYLANSMESGTEIINE